MKSVKALPAPENNLLYEDTEGDNFAYMFILDTDQGIKPTGSKCNTTTIVSSPNPAPTYSAAIGFYASKIAQPIWNASKITTLTVNKWSDLPSSPSNSAIYKIVMPITKMQYYLVGTNAFPANEGPIAVYKTKTNTQTAYQIILAKLNASKKFSSTQKGVISRAIEYILNPKTKRFRTTT